jgi:hypothetical protein
MTPQLTIRNPGSLSAPAVISLAWNKASGKILDAARRIRSRHASGESR